MQGGKFRHNKQRQPRATPQPQSPQVLNNQIAIPNGQGNLGYSLNNQSRVTPLPTPPLGPTPFTGNVDGLNQMNNNNRPTPMLNNGNNMVPGQITRGTTTPMPNNGNNGLGQTVAGPTLPNPAQGNQPQLREHDLYLPIANVVRIMRKALPPHAKVADDAKETFQECVTEFISFVTSEANEACQIEHRKTITAEDVIVAMARLGFDRYVEPLMIYLQRYRESEMLPQVHRPGPSHGANNGPGYEPGLGGGSGVQATRLMPPSNGLPPFPVVHPQYAMFGPAGNGGYYYDGSGPSTGPINMSVNSVAATIHGGNGPNGPSLSRANNGSLNMGSNSAAVSTANDGNGPSLALGIGGGPSGSEGAGPSGSVEDGPRFHGPYGQYK